MYYSSTALSTLIELEIQAVFSVDQFSPSTCRHTGLVKVVRGDEREEEKEQRRQEDKLFMNDEGMKNKI